MSRHNTCFQKGVASVDSHILAKSHSFRDLICFVFGV